VISGDSAAGLPTFKPDGHITNCSCPVTALVRVSLRMHAIKAPVLLRVAGLDEFDADPLSATAIPRAYLNPRRRRRLRRALHIGVRMATKRKSNIPVICAQ
jgi:hypothetical protein